MTIETSVHIAYGYDIRGEVIGETGTVSLAEQNEVVLKVNGAFSGRVFADWPERFDPAFDAEFRAWIGAAAKGGAAGPSAWDGYVATAATLAGVKALESGARERSSCARSRRICVIATRERAEPSGQRAARDEFALEVDAGPIVDRLHAERFGSAHVGERVVDEQEFVGRRPARSNRIS